jgi:macrolide transport system ATP-binding/permease protein
VTVVGILNTSPRLPELLGAILSPVQDAGQLGYQSRTQALILTTVGASQMIARQAPWIINPYEPKSLGVKAPVDPTTLRAQVEAEVQATLFALTGVAFLASIAGLANAMVLSVIERRQEFGLRRALGARPLHIANLVLVESTIIGAIGGLVGLLFGLGATLIVTILRQWGPVFDLSLAPAAIGCGILVGAIGGLLASVRASRIQPNAALRL